MASKTTFMLVLPHHLSSTALPPKSNTHGSRPLITLLACLVGIPKITWPNPSVDFFLNVILLEFAQLWERAAPFIQWFKTDTDDIALNLFLSLIPPSTLLRNPVHCSYRTYAAPNDSCPLVPLPPSSQISSHPAQIITTASWQVSLLPFLPLASCFLS